MDLLVPLTRIPGVPARHVLAQAPERVAYGAKHDPAESANRGCACHALPWVETILAPCLLPVHHVVTSRVAGSADRLITPEIRLPSTRTVALKHW